MAAEVLCGNVSECVPFCHPRVLPRWVCKQQSLLTKRSLDGRRFNPGGCGRPKFPHSSLVRTFTHSHGQMSFAVYVFVDMSECRVSVRVNVGMSVYCLDDSSIGT